jgi:hypothetical protein
VVLSAAEREQLAAIVADCNRPRKHVERAPHRNAKNVIEASRRTSVAKLLFVGSSGIYPRLAPQPVAGKLLADWPARADD